ncbi:conserved hypothetical protein [Vibrio phage 249E41-1]|nr:conserved hypothetical protein [Vibrio phage 249E41-1]CAH9017507.1 conserved hypothetical protein [Vibrio phage 193E37-1]
MLKVGVIDMNKEKFEEQFNTLKNKYNVLWEWNCDMISLADGIMFFKSESDKKPFCNLSGVGYDREGCFGGDFEGFINLMKLEFKKEFGY